MKEDYIVEKLKAFNQRLKEEEEKFKFLRNELARIVETKEQYKGLVKKLKDLDEFKENLDMEIRRENQKRIDETINQAIEKVEREINNSLKSEQKRLDALLSELRDQITEVRGVKDQVRKNKNQAIFDEHLCTILIEELVRERVLSHEEAERIAKRAAIRAKKKE